MTSPQLDRPLRSPAQIMDARRAKHIEFLARIHQLLEVAEALANKIANEQATSTAAARSFDDLKDALSDLRADYLAPADHDLKEWHETWEPVE